MVENPSKMIVLKVDDVLKKKGHSTYRAHIETGIRNNTLAELRKGNVKSIKLDVLEKLCETYAVTPGDLLKLESREEHA